MFDRIVVALDGSDEAEAAGRLGLRIGAALGSRVTAISVIDVRVVEGPAVETLAPLWGEVTGRPFQPEIMRLYRERADEALARLGDAAERIGVDLTERNAEIGVAEDVILDRSADMDLVVMGRRGEHGGFGRRSIGATLWRVLHRSACPVLIGGDASARTPPGDPPKLPRRPLVAWDDTPGGRAALALATGYASSLDGEIRIVHAGDEAADDCLAEAHRELGEADVPWESARLDLRPEEAVAEATARWATDCLFMGAFGRGRLLDLFFGSHTAAILSRVAGPVFVTP